MVADNSKVRLSAEEDFYVPRKLRALISISGLFCFTVSALFLLMLLCPQIVFTGYVHGYLSIVSYEIRYNTNGRSIALPNLDAVKAVAVATTAYVGVLVGVTLLALLCLRKNALSSISLIYGVSASLVVASGVLRYLSQAFSVDAGVLLSYANNGGVFKVRTLAGLVEYTGINATKTLAYDLLFTHPAVILALLYASITSSTASIMWAVYIYGKQLTREERNKGLKPKKFLAKTTLQAFAPIAIVAGVVLSNAGASVFAYYSLSPAINPQPPPATLEQPLYAYTCAVTRTDRTALTYTDFEAYPLPVWDARGGTWSTISGVAGAKGNALRGTDNDGGVGSASQYYYSTSLSGYTTLWVVSKTRWASGTGYYGVMLGRSPLNRVYAVEVHTSGVLYIRSYGVENILGWYTLANTTIPGYSTVAWYVLVVNYTDTGTSIDIRARVYGASGNLLATASASSTAPQRFRPAFIGVTLDAVTAYFDDFLIATSDPRGVLFTNLRAGVSIEMWDNLNNLVAWGTSPGQSLSLSLLHDVVVGTGTDGRIAVKGSDDALICVHQVPNTDAILGGDSYRVETQGAPPSIEVELGANKTSARVNAAIPGSAPGNTLKALGVNASQTLYARLLLDSVFGSTSLNLDIWIEGTTRSTNVTVEGGASVSTSTSRVQLNLGLENHIALWGYFTGGGQSSVLYLRLELCTSPEDMGSCAYYPISLNLSS
ncbi:MAG: hypothetical protein QXK88_04225 [Desulfurococcaceae archaeon]